ncbi:TauD/TfdA family dioxygenase [Streptomyces heilongjiangensis]|uniref:TauD/TfdA family dioxygenase n=1 Tax=Streptomyces heilongjiangensis TaxID=945052 RepID=A0ABW1AZ28_9ACTN|nr:TauD/TfdA family dioxygenase [Streptomyces heilongjiangensis]MDC2951444.1 TauD/TfdA family dioxygenase [Streptomyces heilongjiangensis]
MTSYHLTESEAIKTRELSVLAARLSNSLPIVISGLLLDLPEEMRKPLLNFGADSSAGGHFLLRGLMVDDLPETPAAHGMASLDDHFTNGTLMLVADLVGSLVGYQDEKSGALFHDVHPVRGEEHRIENSGSVAFDFHTENVHHPLRPDFLGLLCLRQDHEAIAATRLSSVRDALPLLTEDQVADLRKPQFHSLYPTSFTRHTEGPRPSAGPHPVIFGSADKPFIRFNSHNTQAADAGGERALRALGEALEHVCRDLILAPGDLVVLDNHVVVHGRSAFQPRYDGSDRWLRRFYSLRSTPLWAQRMMRHPRVLPAMADIRGVV